jgi:hypothetical protein
MKNLWVFGFIFLLNLTACITIDSGKDLSEISLGMSKEQVISVKGKPYERAAREGVEYFIYATFLINGNGKTVQDKYFIRFIADKVDSFGRIGDFDSTKDPTLRKILLVR